MPVATLSGWPIIASRVTASPQAADRCAKATPCLRYFLSVLLLDPALSQANPSMRFLKALPNFAALLVGVTVALALCIVVFALSFAGIEPSLD